VVILQITLEFIRFLLLGLGNFFLLYHWPRRWELVGKSQGQTIIIIKPLLRLV
jgi:hypothetical protein